MGTLAAAGTSNSKTATEPPDASPSSRNRIASCPILISSLLPVTMSTPPLLLSACLPLRRRPLNSKLCPRGCWLRHSLVVSALQPLHASGFPRRPQAVENVVVEPVGGTKCAESRSKTLRKRAFKPPNGAHRRARRSFSTRWPLLGGSVNKGSPPPSTILLAQAPNKLAENRYEPFGLLDVGQVATAWDESEGALFEAAGRIYRLPIRKQFVFRSPYYKRWHL